MHKMEVVEEETANEETANAEHISATAGAYFITEFHRDHMAALHSATPLSSRLPRKRAGSTGKMRVDTAGDVLARTEQKRQYRYERMQPSKYGTDASMWGEREEVRIHANLWYVLYASHVKNAKQGLGMWGTVGGCKTETVHVIALGHRV